MCIDIVNTYTFVAKHTCSTGLNEVSCCIYTACLHNEQCPTSPGHPSSLACSDVSDKM